MAVDRRAHDLRTRLSAAGAVLGVPVIVTDDADWRLDEEGLHVGLGWYRERGHGDSEAVALALLQLWQGVRGERLAPARARRRRTLAVSMPQAGPLLETVLRLQAVAELLIAMPAVHPALALALRRSLPEDLGEMPRHLQWAALLMLEAGGGDVDSAGIDAMVRAERQRLAGEWESDPVRRVLAPDGKRTALQRFERSLALLLPPYERLLAADSAERGLATGDGATVDRENADPDAGSIDAGSDDAGAARASDDSAAIEEEGAGVAADEGAQRARAGEGREAAEGADLFEAEHAAFVSTILPTPMPAGGALLDALLDTPTQHAAGRPDSTDSAGAARGAGFAGHTALAAYRARAETLSAAIEEMRELWARVIAERVATRLSPGRQAQPAGDALVSEALAGAVAEALAGVPRPHAYRQREVRRRRTHRAGSTDYVLLIDRSASMSGPVARAAADAVLIMLEALAGAERDARHAETLSGIPLELDIRTALITFDAEARVVKPLSGGLDDEVRRAVHAAAVQAGGATNDAAALVAAAEQLGVPLRTASDPRGRRGGAGAGGGGPSGGSDSAGIERRRIVIVVSDGGTNDAAAATHALRRLRAAGVSVHGVGIGSDEVVRRYAPTSARIDDPRDIAAALQRLVRDEIP